MTSLSIEIIMDKSEKQSAKAKDNGARIAAWLLWKHKLSINRLVTHTYWVNKYSGKNFSDSDIQCTNPISGEKWCPSYIFASNNAKIALDNWKKFKKQVEEYLNKLNHTTNISIDPETNYKLNNVKTGDLVRISDNATYYNGKSIPTWVKSMNWYISNINGDRAIINKNESGTNSINSPIHIKYLSVVTPSHSNNASFEPYKVKITTEKLNIYADAGILNVCSGCITDKGVYTIIAESNGIGATKWGKLKSGIGWISLDYTKKL